MSHKLADRQDKHGWLHKSIHKFLIDENMQTFHNTPANSNNN